MSEASSSLSVHFTLPNDQTDEEKEEAIYQLRQELLETDVKSVETLAGPSAPPGAKGLPPGLDTLLVTLAGSGSILGTVINAVSSWSREKKGAVTIKYNGNEFTFSNPTAEEQHQLVKACLATLSEKKA
jgi:hypothetical protein